MNLLQRFLENPFTSVFLVKRIDMGATKNVYGFKSNFVMHNIWTRLPISQDRDAFAAFYSTNI